MTDEGDVMSWKRQGGSGVTAGDVPPRERPAGLPRVEDVGRKAYLIEVLDRYLLPSWLLMLFVALWFVAPQFVVFVGVMLLLLSPCVLLHEWGHYVVARRAGMEVKEFSVGFGRRLWSRVNPRTGVRWSLKALPLGGSVAVAGMTVEEVTRDGTDPARAYIYAPIWARIRLALAGVTVNLALAFLAFMAISVALSLQAGASPLAAALGAPVSAVLIVAALVGMTATALWTTVTSLGAEGGVSSLLTAPAAIQDGLLSSTEAGLSPFVYYGMVFAGLNVSLALVNMLPLYLLDGGHAATAAVDGVRTLSARRRGSVERVEPLPSERFAVFNKLSGLALLSFILIVYGRDLVALVTGSVSVL